MPENLMTSVPPAYLARGIDKVMRLDREGGLKLAASIFADLVDKWRIIGQLCWCWRQNGWDVVDLRLRAYTAYAERIAENQLLPELVATLSSKPAVLRRALHLFLEDQDRVARGEEWPLFYETETGIAQVPMKLHEINAREAQQIIDVNGPKPHLRDEREQIAFVRAACARQRAKQIAEIPRDKVLVRSDGSVSVAGVEFTLAGLESLLKRCKRAAVGSQ